MKKILALILIPMFIFSLVGCTSASTENTENVESSIGMESDVTIEETLLFEKDGLKVSATRLVKLSEWNWGLRLRIENDSKQNLGVQCNSASINSYMIPEFFSCTVPAGGDTLSTIYFSSNKLEIAKISTISDIVTSFHIFNSDTYATLFDTDEIELKTSAYSTDLHLPADRGKVLYEKDGIRITGKDINENSFWGKTVLLLIENEFGENITVHCDNLLVNGNKVTPFLSCSVNNDRRAIDEITMLSSDLEKYNIDAIEKLELTFRIINPKTYETITKTDSITYYIS